MASTTMTSTPSGGGSSGRYCFDAGQFAEEGFDPAAFVTAAKEVASLEVLRDHLRGYQKDLREELYEVINRDLADYLKLSSKLSGVEHEVLEIRAPLQEMLGGLQEAREFVAAKREGLHARLAERAALQGRKDTLRRRIRFLHTLADVEHALRLPGAPPPPPPAGRATSTRHMPLLRELLNGPGEGGPAAPAAAGGTGAGLDAPGMTAHCGALERLAHAWLALAADAGAFPATEEEDDVPTAAAVGVRLQRAEKALLGHLAGAFRTVVCPRSLVVAVAGGEGKGQDGAGEGEGDGPLPVNEPALRHCLRAFLVLGRGDEAERQAARLVMLPFVDLNFTQGRLDGGARGSCSGLPAIYAACLRHARRNLGAAVAVAESLLPSSSSTTAGGGLDLVGNGVWRPVHQALGSRLGPAVFAPGIADILHGNYTVSMQFLADLAGLAGPTHEGAVRRRLRAHPCTRDFHARWNLPVYFHLRFTEVAARIDQALSLLAPAPQPMAGEGGGGGDNDAAAVGQRLSHPAFVAVWRALWGLWAPSVFLPPLTPRLVKLMLQVIGRTHRWLDEALDEAAATPSTTPGPSPLLLPPDQPEALVAVAWDALLFSGAPAVRQLAARVVDTVAAARRAEAAGGGGREADEGRDAELRALLEEGLGEAMAPFEAAAARAWALLRGRLVGQCAGALEGGVKGIMAAYRMTNKRAPERACPYVARVLDPLRALEPEVKGRVPPSLAPVWRAQVVTAVTERYLEVTQGLLSSVQQMEDALKKRKQRAKGGTAGAASTAAAEAGAPLSDSEKIQLQLLLDVAAFAQEMGAAGGMTDPLRDCAPYGQLLRAVAPARLLLGRPDVQATLPPAIDAFLSASL